MSAPSASSRHGALTRDEIADLATLAGLAVAPDEARRLADDLGAILDHMSELAAVDTDGVPPMTHAVAVPLRLRPDLVAPSLPVDEALAAAPDRDGDGFRVPAAVIAGKDPGR